MLRKLLSSTDQTAWLLLGLSAALWLTVPLGPQLAETAPGGLDYVFSTNGTDRNLHAFAERLNPFGQIVAIDGADIMEAQLFEQHAAGKQSLEAVADLVDRLVRHAADERHLGE